MSWEMSNTPDDWNSFWSVCSRCGEKHHESEECSCYEKTDEELKIIQAGREEWLINHAQNQMEWKEEYDD